jgi:hypothetical protein
MVKRIFNLLTIVTVTKQQTKAVWTPGFAPVLPIPAGWRVVAPG